MDQNANAAPFSVGERVALDEKKFTGAEEQTGATILEVRQILGKHTYVVETDDGKRKVVGASQVSKLSE